MSKKSPYDSLISIFILGMLAIGGFLLVQVLTPPDVSTPPVNPPPIGFLDYYEHQNERRIEATDLLASIDNALFYHTFPTFGERVCLYGNFTSDRGVQILITDYEGYDEYRTTGDTDSWIYRVRDTLQDDWDITLEPFLDGRNVNTWYVIVSSFGYYLWEFDRHVSYYFCEDRTAPAVSMNIPPVVTGRVTLTPDIRDLHCDISRVILTVNGSEIYNDNPSTIHHRPSIVWNTLQYTNGTYDISLFVEDYAGNNYIYYWISVVNNTSPEVMQQVQFEIIVRGVGVSSGFLAALPVAIPRIRKIKGSTIIVFIFTILAITTTVVTTPEEPEIWTLFNSLSVIGSVCGITSLIYAVGKDILKRLRNRPPKLKGEPHYIG